MAKLLAVLVILVPRPSDGIPNAAGVRLWQSVARLRSGAKIVPRNTLALWGVGAKSHKTFWDGKLIDEKSGVISQFGTGPSQDPLVTACICLPLKSGRP